MKGFLGHQCLILQRGSAGTTAHSMSLSDKQDEVTSHHMFITVVVTSDSGTFSCPELGMNANHLSGIITN